MATQIARRATEVVARRRRQQRPHPVGVARRRRVARGAGEGEHFPHRVVEARLDLFEAQREHPPLSARRLVQLGHLPQLLHRPPAFHSQPRLDRARAVVLLVRAAAELGLLNISVTSFDTVSAGLDALESHDIDALVYDRAILQWSLDNYRDLYLSNLEFMQQYANSMDPADTAIVYFNPEVLAHKKLPALSIDEVQKAFASEKVKVILNSAELEALIQEQKDQHEIIVLMSSGNFDGIDWTKVFD